MKNKNLVLITLIAGLLFVFGPSIGQKSKSQRKLSGNYTFKTECLGVELDGSQTVKSWGAGRNRVDAIEQAYKNAVRDVLFVGISNGKSECNVKPVIFEVNAQEKYEEYFNKFFADAGPYTEFVSNKDGSKIHLEVFKERKQAGSQESYAIIVRVMRAQLVAKMKTDGILKQ
jgi:hypothetical protein